MVSSEYGKQLGKKVSIYSRRLEERDTDSAISRRSAAPSSPLSQMFAYASRER